MILGFRKSAMLYGIVVVLSVIKSHSAQDWEEILSSPPKTKEWIHPDSGFMLHKTHVNERKDTSVDSIEDCLKNLSEFAHKSKECENSLQILRSGCQEDQKTESFVSKLIQEAPSHCSVEERGCPAFLRRFVLLFLEVTALHTGEINSYHEVDLKLSVSGDHLTTLRQFAYAENSEQIPARKVDEVFNAIFVKRFVFIPALADVIPLFLSFKVGSFLVSILIPALWFLCILFWTRNVFKSFMWLLPITFIISFVTTGYKMYDEASLKQYEALMKLKEAPADCNSNSKSFIEQLLSSKTKSDCSEYLKAHNMDSDLDITALRVFSRMIGEAMTDGFSYFGESFLAFISTFEGLAILQRTWIVPLAIFFLFAFLLLIFLVMSGGSIRLPYFLGTLSFHNPGRVGGIPSDSYRMKATTAEALPSSSNITYNITNHLPASSNMHDMLQSIVQNVPIPFNSKALASPSLSSVNQDPMATSFQDPKAAGDGHSPKSHKQTEDSDPVFQFHARERPRLNDPSKKVLKQFSHIEARYKAVPRHGLKHTNRERHQSL